jgi:CRISPR-associated protein Csa3
MGSLIKLCYFNNKCRTINTYFVFCETKKIILEEIQKGVFSVTTIAKIAGISKGMTYNHLWELKSMGYIADGENGFVITDAGRIASI